MLLFTGHTHTQSFKVEVVNSGIFKVTTLVVVNRNQCGPLEMKHVKGDDVRPLNAHPVLPR